MISEVVMPQMGADMVEGTIVRWLKNEGDEVTRGEIIAEIETDKANVEIEAFESGIFRKVLASEGDVVPVGGVIAVIAGAEDDISSYAGAAPASAPERAAPKAVGAQPAAPAGVPVVESDVPSSPPAVEPAAANGAGRLRVSPVARRLAEERNIDLRTVRGSGPDGRIIRRDVEAAASGEAPRPSEVASAVAASADGGPARSPLAPSRMRQAIARRMSQSKREAPHYYLLIDIDMTDAMALRAQANSALPEEQRISVNDMLVRASALALKAHPAFNATISGDAITQHERQHVCIGIALDDGLIAPAILDAGGKSLVEIAVASKDLVGRAKGGALRPDEITAGTFTISNLGAYGIETLVAIIQPPQTAILGAGAVAEQAAVRDGEVVVRKMLKVALSADHRVTDGAQGAQLLTEIRRLLEAPVLLVL
jgi:pyruvate dehydrogenase E2 component (dihydrolipoamide acetyltransferase)